MAALSGNYATTTQVLQDGRPKPIDNDSDGVDGGTIGATQIVPTMESLGWPEDIWDYDSVTGSGGPKLINTPERAAP